VTVAVEEACGLVAAADITGAVNCPSATCSAKDGFAVLAEDLNLASPEQPVRLELIGTIVAGAPLDDLRISPGQAIKVMTGAILPQGATSVIASEFTREEGGSVLCFRNAHAGRNLHRQGSDVASGQILARANQLITPALTGLLAAGGRHSVSVIPRPRVAIIATGDEIVSTTNPDMPTPLQAGQLYASNLVTLKAWLGHFRMSATAAVVKDQPLEIRQEIENQLSQADALLTSGGAWKSERDFTAAIFDQMGWQKLFHRVRIGPGKAVAFGLLGDKPIFCLPGGPASNEMAFLQIALPALLQMSARQPEPFPIANVRLGQDISGVSTWTQFFQAKLHQIDGEYWANPVRGGSRLQAQAQAEALIHIPEGIEAIVQGSYIPAQILPNAQISPIHRGEL
jgi:molybdopterin molybdotransferase